MKENQTKPLNLASGRIVREALANDEIREGVRARLLAEGKLPHYTREKIASIVKAFLVEEAGKDSIRETEPPL